MKKAESLPLIKPLYLWLKNNYENWINRLEEGSRMQEVFLCRLNHRESMIIHFKAADEILNNQAR